MDKTLKSLSSLSLVGWALFLILSSSEIKSAIEYYLPKSLKAQNGAFFWGIVLVFFISGFLILFVKKWNTIASILIRIVLGGTFILAAIPKILDPKGFALDITHYDFFPKIAVNLIAITVPWIELFIAFSIIFAVAQKGGVLLLNLMLIAFLVLLGQAWIRGLDIDCGCFGHSGAREAVSKAFVRDLFFVIWAILLYLFIKKPTLSESRN
ncbi:MAG: hypothetical protein N2445_07020 [Acidobacteria bacterium]|nr:hypothetical protein [Acidobacteriota bacterium]